MQQMSKTFQGVEIESPTLAMGETTEIIYEMVETITQNPSGLWEGQVGTWLDTPRCWSQSY